MKKVLLPFMTFSLATLLGCGSGSDEASLRVVHNSPDAPAVDILLDGAPVLEDVPYPLASSYLTVDAGARNIQVAVAGTSTVVIDATPTLEDGKSYTVIAANKVASIEPLLLTDDRTAPAKGNVKIRVVHGAPSAPAVDVFATAPDAPLAGVTPVLTSVPFKGVSGYLEVPAGTYQFRVAVAGTTTVAIDSGAISFDAGEVYTVVARDATGGGAPFGLTLLKDR